MGTLITTEQATTLYGLSLSAVSGLAGLLVTRKMSNLDADKINANKVILPLVFAGGGILFWTLFIPSQSRV